MKSQSEILLDFYGAASLHVSGPPKMIKFLRSEWAAFEVEAQRSDPDIVAEWNGGIVRGAPDRDGTELKRAGGWYKGCFWRATVRGGNGHLEVRYSTMPPSSFLFKDSCLEPLVLSKLASEGLHGLHASSVMIRQKAWVFCGQPGSGKTVLALIGAKNGYTVLSDDVTLLSEGRVLPYGVPPRVSPREYLTRNLPGELNPQGTLSGVVLSSILNHATFGKIRIPTRVRLRQVPSPSLEGYPLGGIFLLRWGKVKPAIRLCHDKEWGLSEAVRSIPLHGASIINRLALDEPLSSKRRIALKSQLDTLVDQRRCFELDALPKMSNTGWRLLSEEVFANIEQLELN